MQQPTIPVIVPYNKFSASKIYALSPENKTSKPKVPGGPTVSYTEQAIQYNYGTEDVKKIDDLLKEEPIATSMGGIYTNKGDDGRISRSILAKWELNAPETKVFLESHEAMYQGIVQIVNQNKGPLKMFNFRPDLAEATGFKNPLTYPRDKLTGAPIPGKNPQMYFKIDYKTIFTDLNDKVVPHERLVNVQMKFIPLVNYKNLYSGGGNKVSLQVKLRSAVVLEIKKLGSETQQKSTTERYRAEHPDMVNQLNEQLAMLDFQQQDTLHETKGATPPVSAPPVPSSHLPVPPTPSMSDMLSTAPRNDFPSGLTPPVPSIPTFNSSLPTLPPLPKTTMQSYS